MVKSKADSEQRLIAAQAVRDAISRHARGWNHLEELSKDTEIDNVEVFEDEIIMNGERFSGSFNVYVTLNYGGKGDWTSMSDAYPGVFHGHFEGKEAVVDNVLIDTSSFYE